MPNTDLLDSVLFRRYPTSVVSSIPVIEGQVIFEVAQDKNGKILYDHQGVRRTMGGNYLPLYTVSLPVSGWSATAPYTQTVNVAGVSKDDVTIPVLNQSGVTSEANQRNMMLAFSSIAYYDVEDGKIIATAPFTKPATDIKVNFIGQ